jgi:DNA-binding response OmpR family regulator
MPNNSVLLVEDEPHIRQGLSMKLREEGFSVFEAEDGEVGEDIALQKRPDLIVLDVMLPGRSGLDVCRNLRKGGFSSPIILLTARAETIDIVLGLELGADDYVTKPFSLRELVARIRTRLRVETPKSFVAPDQYQIGPTLVDFAHSTALRDGRGVELTQRELAVLRLLIANKGEPVSRDQMLDQAWGYDAFPSTRTVDMLILRLRQKIESDPANPRHILSEHRPSALAAGLTNRRQKVDIDRGAVEAPKRGQVVTQQRFNLNQ